MAESRDMDEQELTFAVARAFWPDVKVVGGIIYGRPDDPELDWISFDPLYSDADAFKLIGWLAERNRHFECDEYGCWVRGYDGTAGRLTEWADHPTKDDAIRRCLCEAAAAVGEVK